MWSGVDIEVIRQVWIASLVLFVVVLAVVAVLLSLIVRTARGIEAGVQAIWNTGQRIAGNTVHIALLDGTLAACEAILEASRGLVEATAAIKRHAEDCPGCPHCILGSRRAF